jgi:antitoxin (DNA-binding transcriptional repressor) of toxin-antitoxin stability system
MLEITATDLRKDLFKVLDRLSEGEEVRVRRKGRVLSLKAISTNYDDVVAEHRRKFQAGLERGVREDWADFDAGDITDGRHIEWTPEDN